MKLKSLNNFSFLSPLPFFYLYLFKYLSTSKPIFLSSSVSLFLLLLILCKCSISLQTTSSKTCKLICRQRFFFESLNFDFENDTFWENCIGSHCVYTLCLHFWFWPQIYSNVTWHENISSFEGYWIIYIHAKVTLASQSIKKKVKLN